MFDRPSTTFGLLSVVSALLFFISFNNPAALSVRQSIDFISTGANVVLMGAMMCLIISSLLMLDQTDD